jgi:Flp pilus assembly protein TadD
VTVCALLYGCASGGQADRRAHSDAGAAGDAQAAAGQVVPERARTLYEQAVAVMAAGDHTDAELRFTEFLLQYPDYPGAHVNLAIIRARAGDDAGAEASIGKALALNAQYAPALNQLGMLRRRQGRFDEAEAAYEQAIAADSSYALAHYNLAVLNELYLQRLEPALQHFETYQSLTAGDEQVSKWIADLKRRLGSNQRSANVTE